ncbi:hypothetical protein L195_g012632 [Trifolium pratense]|uniref:Retrotransposon gag domain-containing protein n=1 Tax=Trifolium pratense TaxID=57577 RepID=A0A2K3PKX6_TRIPR|nr:hypothetical protein L195_g012632 [Trifolium pratense]
MNFKQHEIETLGESYERFNLLKRKCPNHSLDLMELMQIFTGGMRIQHRMHLDASAGGSINAKTAEEVKELIEQMCQNEYNMSNERTSKPAEMLQLDKETAYPNEIDLQKRKLEKATLAVEVKKVHEICDFCHENHPNGYCVPEGISDEEHTKFMGRPSSYSSWRDQNPRWNQSYAQGTQQAQQPRKPPPLEETFNQFVKISQTNFENMQSTAVNQGASIKNLETQIGQLTKLITNFSENYAGNTVDNPTKEIGMTLEEAYDEFMEELEEYYEETLAEKLSIESKLPPKQRDHGTFTTPFCLGKVQGKALCDLGSSINLMPLKFAKR